MIAKWLLATAIPFGCIACWCAFELVSSAKNRLVCQIVGCVFVLIETFAIAKYTIREPLSLTVFEDKHFTDILRTGIMSPPDSTIIACPDNEEDTCEFAASFIPLFQRAGWRIENAAVERVRIGRPTKDISVVTSGPPLVNPQDPDHGVWTQINPWAQTLNTDFMLLGITPTRLNDPELPITKVRIYFGSIPERKRLSLFSALSELR